MKSTQILENLPRESSHQHWCATPGHYYDCSDDCLCVCGLPMNGNDHSKCPVELRECPQHLAEPPVPEKPSPEGLVDINFSQPTVRHHCKCGCSAIDGTSIVGFCFWCTHVYASYSPEIEARHFAEHCPSAPSGLRESARAGLSTN